MTVVVKDVPITVMNSADLDKVLNAGLPVLLYVYNGESPRGDVKTELDKVAKDHAGRLHILKVDTSSAPDIAQRFDLGKYPLLLSWANGEVLARRNRPWGTDVTGMADDLLKLAPDAPEDAAEPKAEKVVVDSKPIQVTEATFEQEVLNSKLPVLVDFWAAWCGPCRQVAPILDKLAAEFAGKIRIAKVDVDANQGLSGAFRIMSIPTLMFIKNGKIVGQQAGALPEHVLRDAINQLINLKI